MAETVRLHLRLAALHRRFTRLEPYLRAFEPERQPAAISPSSCDSSSAASPHSPSSPSSARSLSSSPSPSSPSSLSSPPSATSCTPSSSFAAATATDINARFARLHADAARLVASIAHSQSPHTNSVDSSVSSNPQEDHVAPRGSSHQRPLFGSVLAVKDNICLGFGPLPAAGMRSEAAQHAVAHALESRAAEREDNPQTNASRMDVDTTDTSISTTERYRQSGFRYAAAEAVRRLSHAGCLVLGRTALAPLAQRTPAPATRNPAVALGAPARSPGGSSSGSAAAVAGGLCDLALGTQTAGSVTRPAAFCGVLGFVPPFGAVSTAGLVPAAPSLDVVGLFARDWQLLRTAAACLVSEYATSSEAAMDTTSSVVAEACHPEAHPAGAAHGIVTTTVSPAPPLLPDRPLRWAIPRGAFAAQAGAEARALLDDVVLYLEQEGQEVTTVTPWDAETLATVSTAHADILAAEFARYFSTAMCAEPTAGWHADAVALATRGSALSAATVAAARRLKATEQKRVWALQHEAGVDAWLAPAAVGPANVRLESTGDASMSLPWSLLGASATTLPCGTYECGMPAALQVLWLNGPRAGEYQAGQGPLYGLDLASRLACDLALHPRFWPA